jgi:hypothetical protein
VQPRLGAFPSPQVQPLGNPTNRQDRFASQPAGNLQLGGVAFKPEFQVGAGPFEPPQFFPNDAFGFGFGEPKEFIETA